MSNKFLIVGLGNMGNEYVNTRHNIGFDVVEYFVAKHEGNFRTERLADVSEIKWHGKIFICIKPSTFMNLSGKAFKYWMDKERVNIENTLTIVDDLALPITALRLRSGGSDAGHNGLKNIQSTINTTEYPRLRFGIGNNYPKGMQVEFVLSKWFKEDIPLIKFKIEKSAEIIENFAINGIERTMSMFNKKIIQLPTEDK